MVEIAALKKGEFRAALECLFSLRAVFPARQAELILRVTCTTGEGGGGEERGSLGGR